MTESLQAPGFLDHSPTQHVLRYQYDRLNRLTHSFGGHLGNTSYTDDRVGNRPSRTRPNITTRNLSYDMADHLLGDGTLTSTNDRNGNITAVSDSQSVSYDYANRLVTATVPGPSGHLTTRYVYDDGRRIEKRQNGSSIDRFVYAGGKLLEDTERRCVYGQGLEYSIQITTSFLSVCYCGSGIILLRSN